MIQYAATLTIQFLFVLLIVYAMISDITKLVIPNWLSISLLILFLAHFAIGYPSVSLASNFAVMGVVFACTALLFHFGFLGGGDVKLMTVLSLWVGPDHILEFIVLVNILGALLALFVIRASRMVDRNPTENSRILTTVGAWRSQGICPYGIAIGSAALFITPAIFA